jgi:hypothetical protein
MLKQIELKDISNYKLGFKISFPLNSKDIYFALDKDFAGNLWDYIDKQFTNSKLPEGVYQIHAIDNTRHFRVSYNPSETSPCQILTFLRTIF